MALFAMIPGFREVTAKRHIIDRHVRCVPVQIPKNVVVGTEGFEFTSNGKGSIDAWSIGSDVCLFVQILYLKSSLCTVMLFTPAAHKST